MCNLPHAQIKRKKERKGSLIIPFTMVNLYISCMCAESQPLNELKTTKTNN